MKRISILFIILVGLFTFSSCEKDETKAVLNGNPTSPSISGVDATLVLKRADAQNTITIKGANVDFGYQASVTYTLEVDDAGNSFKNPLTIATAQKDTFTMKILDFNAKLLERYDGDVPVNLQVRVVATVASNVAAVYSDVKSVTVTPYGLPRLDLLANDVVIGKVQSKAGDGVYVGYVKLAAGSSFKLKDPDANKIYGGASSLVENGDAIDKAKGDKAFVDGYYKIEVDVNKSTYTISEFRIGIVGDATTDGWSATTQHMEYNVKFNYWYISIDLTANKVKFRMNDDWGWNLGTNKDKDPDLNDLVQNGADIQISAAGNYTVKLFINSDEKTGKCTITKN